MPTRTSPADYAPRIDGIEFGAVYAKVREGLGEAAILTALAEVAAMHRHSTWWLGDLLADGPEVWDNYADAAEATGFAAGSLRNMASISRSVPPEVREPGLPWRTHKVVAHLEDPEEQRRWLRVALDEDVKSDDLHRRMTQAGDEVHRRRRENEGAEEEAQTHCPSCGRELDFGPPARLAVAS